MYVCKYFSVCVNQVHKIGYATSFKNAEDVNEPFWDRELFSLIPKIAFGFAACIKKG